MKVLIIYHDGATHNGRAIFKALSRCDGVSLSVIIPSMRRVDTIYEPSGWLRVEYDEERDDYRTIPVPLRDPASYCRGYKSGKIYSVFRYLQPDIIHVLDEPWSFCLFQATYLKLAAFSRAKVLFYGFENLAVRLRGISRVLWPQAWKQITGGMAANSEQLQHLRRLGFPKARPLKRVFWGIPTDVFRPMDRRLVRCKLGIECEHLVGFVGRYVPEKGLRVLCEAMHYLPIKVHCLLIGSGPLRPELEAMAKQSAFSGRLHLHAPVGTEALAEYMCCMDVIVVPSLTTAHWKEQYGRVIGEGMACGIPVVGSDSGAIPEVMGSAGLVVREGDGFALAEAVMSALFDRQVQERMQREGRQRAEEEFSCNAMARQLIEFYEQVVRY